tara:strand:- start:678 stop:905 length:228 start_codon:yes stop_codon:yes gene_type:complete
MITLKEKIEIMQHFRDGGDVEISSALKGGGDWYDVPDPCWDWSRSYYRKKLKVLEMTMQEVSEMAGRTVKIVENK